MKKIILFALMLALCVSFVACGDKAEVTTDAAETNAVTIPTEDVATEENVATTEAVIETTVEATEEATEEVVTTTDVADTTEVTEATEAVATTEAPAAEETAVATTAATTSATTEAKKEINPADVAKALEDALASFKSGNAKEGTYLGDSAFAGEDEATFTALYAKFAYKTGEVKIVDEKNATVKAEITMVDVAAALTNYMTEIMAHASEDDWDSDFAVFYSLLSGDKAVMKTYDLTINMVMTDNGWDISADGNDEFKNAITGGLLMSDLLS